MNARIENQVKLMQEAIREINSIKTAEALFLNIDNSYIESAKKRHIEKYAELMAELAATIIHDSKTEY